MNLVKLQICKELLDVSKDAYGKYKHGSGGNGQNSAYSYYGYGAPNQCHCKQGGRPSKDPMQLISSIKNSKHLKGLPQTLQGLASKHGRNGGHHGGVKKILPQVFNRIKTRMF